MKVEVTITMEHGTYSAEAESEVGDTEVECVAMLLEQASYGALAAAGFNPKAAKSILGCPLCNGEEEGDNKPKKEDCA